MKYLMTVTAWLLLSLCAHAEEKFCLHEDLQQLDKVVAQKTIYEQAKLKEISRCKQGEGNYITDIDKYTYQELLYQEFLKWHPDSAIAHAKACQKIAFANKWTALYKKACIQEAYVKVLCGELLDASMLIQHIGSIQKLSKENQTQMGILMLEFNLRAKIRLFESPLTKSCQDAWNYYSPYIPKNNWRYIYYEALLTRHGNVNLLLAQLKRCKQPSYEAAALTVAISQLYYQQKNINAYLHYLIVSAINDIECANREASSLVSLINSPYSTLCPSQAFRYAMLCTENVKTFKDEV